MAVARLAFSSAEKIVNFDWRGQSHGPFQISTKPRYSHLCFHLNTVSKLTQHHCIVPVETWIPRGSFSRWIRQLAARNSTVFSNRQKPFLTTTYGHFVRKQYALFSREGWENDFELAEQIRFFPIYTCHQPRTACLILHSQLRGQNPPFAVQPQWGSKWLDSPNEVSLCFMGSCDLIFLVQREYTWLEIHGSLVSMVRHSPEGWAAPVPSRHGWQNIV